MNRPERASVARGTLTFLGAVLAAMVVIAGLACLALFIVVAIGMNNFGSNK